MGLTMVRRTTLGGASSSFGMMRNVPSMTTDLLVVRTLVDTPRPTLIYTQATRATEEETPEKCSKLFGSFHSV
jgi:hypothetical protein